MTSVGIQTLQCEEERTRTKTAVALISHGLVTPKSASAHMPVGGGKRFGIVSAQSSGGKHGSNLRFRTDPDTCGLRLKLEALVVK